ncbi:MAG TPA: Gfo/Idh/MocA family oxidoreductase [Vicinamibacteria bacterium]
MSERTKVGVMGVGHLGSRHARLYAESAGAELVGVADVDIERARAVAASHGVRAVADFTELVSEIDAASVAVPTVSHRDVTLRLLDAGVHVLVEKPIAASLPEAREMVDLAREKALVLAVGHTERHNPAVEALLRGPRDPRFIEVHRLGSFSPRSLDIDVVLDLMIHDLDVVSTLVGQEVSSLEAVGVPVLTGRIDIANARLRFANGCVANVTASRVSQEKIRKLRFFEWERYVSLDYQKQEAVSYRLVRSPGAAPEIRREDLTVLPDEPLRRELEDFLHAVVTGGSARVTGEDGLKALALALEVVQDMEKSRV